MLKIWFSKEYSGNKVSQQGWKVCFDGWILSILKFFLELLQSDKVVPDIYSNLEFSQWVSIMCDWLSAKVFLLNHLFSSSVWWFNFKQALHHFHQLPIIYPVGSLLKKLSVVKVMNYFRTFLSSKGKESKHLCGNHKTIKKHQLFPNKTLSRQTNIIPAVYGQENKLCNNFHSLTEKS